MGRCTYGEVLDLVGNLVEDLVLAHAVGVVVAAEADDDEAVFLAEDRLVDVPAGAEMRENDGTHFGMCFSKRVACWGVEVVGVGDVCGLWLGELGVSTVLETGES